MQTGSYWTGEARAAVALLGVCLAFLVLACRVEVVTLPAEVASDGWPVLADTPPEALALVDEAPPAAEPAAVVAPFPAPPAWAAPPYIRPGVAPAPQLLARAAVLVDEASGAVLFEKDGMLPLPPASLTKIATLVLALESGRLDDWVDVDVDSREMPGSSIMGLRRGDRFTLRDLAYGLMLPSGNDAALAIGRHISGSDEAFVAEMNRLLARLGLIDSHFANAHGLGAPGHMASAHDLAMLARYGMSLPGFAEIVAARDWTAQGSRTISLRNVNTFLGGFPGADGLKTGYTRAAGPTLVASATRDGHRLYAVLLNSPNRDEDARRLLAWAFDNLRWD